MILDLNKADNLYTKVIYKYGGSKEFRDLS